MKKLQVAIVFLLLLSSLNAQNIKSFLSQLHEKYETFKYEEVVFLADSFITHSQQPDSRILKEVLRLKAVSHFSLNQKNHSRLAFEALLKIDSVYTLSPAENPPKIITFFNDIKRTFKPETKKLLPNERPKSQSEDSTTNKKFVNGAIKSLVLPGWGHTYINDPKGKWYMAGSIAGLSTAIWLYVSTNRYEEKYLNETDAEQIESRFKKYKSYYQARNMAIGLYALYWAYLQYDFLNLSDFSQENPQLYLSSGNNQSDLQITLSFHF